MNSMCAHCKGVFPLQLLWHCQVSADRGYAHDTRKKLLCDSCRDRWLEQESGFAVLREQPAI